jgi:anthranilate synthase component 2
MTDARKTDIEKGPVERILVFDNYDSFTYNLVQLVERITGLRPDVRRNDEMPLAEAAQYDRIILSPGPGIPEEAGRLLPLIRAYASSIPMLGVCLGHQAIGETFGASLSNLSQVYHGVASEVRLVAGLRSRPGGGDWFTGLPEGITVGRYHSWVVEDEGMPDCLEVTARDADGRVMAIRHRTFDVQGVQFHPESILTPEGARMLRSWLGGGRKSI